MIGVRTMKMAMAVLATVAALGIVGCQREAEPTLQPKVTPPAIADAGVLRAGVDLETPPFAGEDAGRRAGIDVDVAAALAERLGLKVEYVDVKPSEAATALAEGTVDAVFSVSVAGADLSRLTPAGTYLASAPAVFVATEGTASVEPSLTLDTLPTSPVAVQSESQSYWLLRSELGSDAVEPYDTLREALEAVETGDTEVAAGDALVAGYILRDLPSVRFAGQLQPAAPLAVAVAPDNTVLSEAVRSALDELAADGVLDSVRRKWVGDLPELKLPDAQSQEATP